MTAKSFGRRWRSSFAAFLCVLAMAGLSSLLQSSRAQASRLVLISQETSTRGIALDSVTLKREPFDSTSEVSWGNDNQTRIMLFAMGLDPKTSTTSITANAEDGSNKTYSLTVEYVGPVPEQSWVTAVVVRINEQMGDVGDVLVGISYQGLNSNRVRVGVGHVGDGPPDDAGAVPTPGTIAPPVQLSATAGTLTTSEVQTIIAQAVSAAAQLGRPVTVAVTDREGNVLGVFKMTGAPAITQFRGGGPGPSKVPSPVTGFVPVGLDATIV